MDDTKRKQKNQGNFRLFLNFSKNSKIGAKFFVFIIVLVISGLFFGIAWAFSQSIEASVILGLLAKPWKWLSSFLDGFKN